MLQSEGAGGKIVAMKHKSVFISELHLDFSSHGSQILFSSFVKFRSWDISKTHKNVNNVKDK